MPYAPGIQDISGQLLAQGMLGAAQTRAQAMGDVGQFMRSFGSEILKNEEERQKTTGAIKAFIDDPYYQQKIAQNPELTNAVDRIKAGKAGSAEVKGFLGTLTTMQHTREEQMKADQIQAQTQYNQALREQAIANTAATTAATAERQRMRDEAMQRAKLLSQVFGTEQTEAQTPEDTAFFDEMGLDAPAIRRQLSASEGFREFVRKGGVPDEATIRMFGGLMGEEMGQEKLESQRQLAAAREAGRVETEAAKREGAINVIREREAAKTDEGIRAINAMQEAGEITPEEAKELRKRRLEVLLEKRNAMADLVDVFRNGFSGGAGSTGGTIVPPSTATSRTGKSRSTPTITADQYKVLSTRPSPTN
jgi:hypothetical protein